MAWVVSKESTRTFTFISSKTIDRCPVCDGFVAGHHAYICTGCENICHWRCVEFVTVPKRLLYCLDCKEGD